MSDTPTITLSLDNTAAINVPDSLTLMTRFVLQEQGDWFEDELPFIRTLLKPGMHAVDIGANVGCYALSMAAAVGHTGKVWAFEPCQDTLKLLSSSKKTNNFEHLNLIQAGLSNKNGTATLYKSHNSELNSLHPKPDRQYAQEIITLLTLDEYFREHPSINIDFLKLDAEGDECNILLGGQKFFDNRSPLVMFELKHGGNVHHALIDDFKSLGYDSFVLNKTLGVLVPFNPNSIEGFQLNLFCAKPDRAQHLNSQDLLFFDQVNSDKPAKEAQYQHGIKELEAGNDENASPLVKLQHWHNALSIFEALSIESPNDIALACAYVRSALNVGERRKAVIKLQRLISLTKKPTPEHQDATIVAPIARYDQLKSEPHWVRASILESYVHYHAFSSYFSGEHAVDLLKELNGSAFATPRYKAQEKVIRQRYA